MRPARREFMEVNCNRDKSSTTTHLLTAYFAKESLHTFLHSLSDLTLAAYAR